MDVTHDGDSQVELANLLKHLLSSVRSASTMSGSAAATKPASGIVA
jgi:hypothetical protein